MTSIAVSRSQVVGTAVVLALTVWLVRSERDPRPKAAISPPPPKARRPAVPSPEPSAPQPDLTVEQFIAGESQREAEKIQLAHQCAAHGGRACCGQGGCCNARRVILGPHLSTEFPFVTDDRAAPIVELLINGAAAELSACYERAWLEPGPFQLVLVDLELDRDGSVIRSSGSGFDDEVAVCMAGVLAGLPFPASPAPFRVTTSFELSSDDRL